MMFAKKVAANPSESGVITESSGGCWGFWESRIHVRRMRIYENSIAWLNEHVYE